MICSCARQEGHRPDCLVAQAMKYRCPDCRSRRRPALGGRIRHMPHCKLKEFQP